MKQWFYAHKGEQKGPVSEAELARLAQTGEFLPGKDLVWREGMGDWKNVAEVPELNLSAGGTASAVSVPVSPAARTGISNNPYQAPIASNYASDAPDGDEPPEIEPGTEVLGITECISRSFDLTKRYFGIIFAVWVIYIAISFGVGLVQGVIESLAGVPSDDPSAPFRTSSGGSGYSEFTTTQHTPVTIVVQLITNLISHAVTIFITLGMTRFALNLMAGKPAEIGMIFGEGSKFIRGFVASLLYGLIVVLGTLLFIVPGIYFALKYSQAQTALVDKDLGIWESFEYSSRITQNNKWALLGLGILLFLINIGGALALCVGMIFTIPLTWLAWLLAYRWLKHGPAALEDRGLLRAGGMR